MEACAVVAWAAAVCRCERQRLLPPELVLRCRVAFHALQFWREIQRMGAFLVRR
jgi:hypothetical protein